MLRMRLRSQPRPSPPPVPLPPPPPVPPPVPLPCPPAGLPPLTMESSLSLRSSWFMVASCFLAKGESASSMVGRLRSFRGADAYCLSTTGISAADQRQCRMTITDEPQNLRSHPFDKERLRQKYMEERNKRLRPD